MKTKGYIALFILLAVAGLNRLTYAQEGGFIMPDNEETNNTVETTRGENSRTGYRIDPEKKLDASASKEKKHSKAVKEGGAAKKEAKSSAATTKKSEPQSSPAENSPKKTEEDEDSVLSFNVLYYMIQKFKFSDVIDQ